LGVTERARPDGGVCGASTEYRARLNLCTLGGSASSTSSPFSSVMGEMFLMYDFYTALSKVREREGAVGGGQAEGEGWQEE